MRRTKRRTRSALDVDGDHALVESEAPDSRPTTPPSDGDHNQGGALPAGIEYQRDLGAEQDA